MELCSAATERATFLIMRKAGVQTHAGSVTAPIWCGAVPTAARAMHDCDVIIVNHNAGHFLARCVASLPSLVSRVIVVDNASEDESLSSLMHERRPSARLTIIRNAQNLGFSAGCNIGIAASEAQYLLFLNPDCALQPRSLERMLEVMDDQPTVGMLGGLLLDPDGKEQAGGRRAIPTPWLSFVRGFGLSRLFASSSRWFADFDLHEQKLPDAPVDVDAISGALMLVRRKAVESVGSWDEAYFLHCEDLDWCMRFRQNGWRILFVPDAPVIHDKGVCSRARPVFVEWHKHRGMLIFFRKFFRDTYPRGIFWVISVGVWLRFLLVVIKLQAHRVLVRKKAISV